MIAVMDAYDPDQAPAAESWLALDEDVRLQLVMDYHKRERSPLPNARLHAAIHVVIENQIALRDKAVRDTVARLQSKGLTRHDALHRIGHVVTELLLEASGAQEPDRETLGQSYEQRLAALMAEE
jgi:hypothetical protein